MNHMPGDLPETRSGTFIVGDLYLDVGSNASSRRKRHCVAQSVVPTSPALVRAAPNILGNDSLMTQVWLASWFSPETINKRVNLLREALGDDPHEPRYITGVRSRAIG